MMDAIMLLRGVYAVWLREITRATRDRAQLI
ncbi:MAG: ABC transporter, partial [Burkholderiales bacterium]